jgi:hypothetical protein
VDTFGSHEVLLGAKGHPFVGGGFAHVELAFPDDVGVQDDRLALFEHRPEVARPGAGNPATSACE